jgi:hypothetical protein
MIFAQFFTIRKTIKDIKEKAADPEQAVIDYLNGTILPFIVNGYLIFAVIFGFLLWGVISTGNIFTLVLLILITAVIVVYTNFVLFVRKIMKNFVQSANKSTQNKGAIDVEVKE